MTGGEDNQGDRAGMMAAKLFLGETVPRKLVFTGAVMTANLSQADEEALAKAFGILQDLADRDVLEFRKNAGRTVGIGRNQANSLTPQALEVLRYGFDKDKFVVTGLRAATGFNRNSLSAVLHGLTQSGYLRRELLDGKDPSPATGNRPLWSYSLTEGGRDAVELSRSEEDPVHSVPGL